MTPPRWLFWHRRDLRLADNRGLAAAATTTPAVTGVFVLDPAILSDPTMAPARLWFLSESLRELEQSWQQAGSRLVILRGDPAELLPRLASALGADVVAWNRDVEPFGRERDRRVARALQAEGRHGRAVIGAVRSASRRDGCCSATTIPLQLLGPTGSTAEGHCRAAGPEGCLSQSHPSQSCAEVRLQGRQRGQHEVPLAPEGMG